MITFDEEMNSLPPERRAKIEAKTQELLQEMELIKEIREQLGFSQKEPPDELNDKQLSSSKHDDLDQSLNLKKLTNLVKTLGGEWELILKFPQKETIKLTSSLEIKY